MNILLCNYEYPPLGGGGGVVMAALARELARRHSVTVLTSCAPGLPRDSLEEGVRLVRVPVFVRRQLAVANMPSMLAYLPMAALRAPKLQREQKFDVINTHFVVPTGPLGQLLSTAFGIPNVLSVHGGDLYDPSKRSSPHLHWWLRAPIRRLLRSADALVGQSRDTLNRVREIYHVERQTELIPLGIDRPPSIAAVAREQLGVPADAFVLATVGRLVARKAVLQLLQVLQQCGRPRTHLLVVGDGPELELIRATARQTGLENRVHLLGQVSETRKYEALAVSDAFVSTSQHEGFGLVFLEAMASGLPVICYDRGGQTDFLRTGETGWVIALNDITAFTKAVVELHDSPELRLRLSEQNRKRVESYFIDQCARRYEVVFEATLKHAGRALRRAAL